MARRGRLNKEIEIPREGRIDMRLKFRAYRIFIGATQKQVAECLGDYHRSHIAHIEIGTDPIPSRLLAPWAVCLNTTLEELEGASNEKVIEWLQTGRSKEGWLKQIPLSTPEITPLQDLIERTKRIEEIQREILELTRGLSGLRKPPQDYIPK